MIELIIILFVFALAHYWNKYAMNKAFISKLYHENYELRQKIRKIENEGN